LENREIAPIDVEGRFDAVRFQPEPRLFFHSSENAASPVLSGRATGTRFPAGTGEPVRGLTPPARRP
jgi:hypothetical protein